MGLCVSKGANYSEIWQGGEPVRMRLTGQRASIWLNEPGNWTGDEIWVSIQELIGPLQNPEKEDMVPAPGRNFLILLQHCSTQVLSKAKRTLAKLMTEFWN